MKQKYRRVVAMTGVILVAVASFYAGTQKSVPVIKVKLDNARVTVSESLTPGGGQRDSYVRPTDQLIIFLDDAQYEAVENGVAHARQRKAGEVIWHSKGETAPTLLNKGEAYRNLIIALK
jgi:hypothetical protein